MCSAAAAPSKLARTKTVATVGPACQSPETLMELVDAGVDVFRLNMAHGTREAHQTTLHEIRRIEASTKRPLGILVDLAGPKIRLGQIAPDPLTCHEDERFAFVRGGTPKSGRLTCTYDHLIDELGVGDRVLLADGTVEFCVEEVSNDEATCRVVESGEIRSRQGINLPGVKLSAPAISDQDEDNARWAAEHGVDFVGLSFVRTALDVRQLQEILRQAGSDALTIAKIEKPEAIANLESIVQAADGIMVARGDLGVEIDVARMPVEQKRIIDTCSRWQRPVIVATQMLDSMQRSNRPTRAEATDVANAIIDGADACMLSAETAIGRYPIESVRMMNRIMESTEAMMEQSIKRGAVDHGLDDVRVHPVTYAVVRGAGQIAEAVDAKLVAVATRSGATALTKSKRRDFIRTVAVSDCSTTLRQMCLYWGISPLYGAVPNLDDDLVKFVDHWGRDSGELDPGDRVVFVTGTGVREGVHNLLMVHDIES